MDIIVVGKGRSEAFQTTVSAEPIHENDIVNPASIKLGRALIPS